MKSLKIWGGIAVLLVSQLASASPLDAPLTQFFQQRLAGISDDVSVTVKTPEAQLPACPQPDFVMPNNGRMWGNVSIQARCGNDKRYIQAVVAASGDYVVAAQALARGTALNESNVQMKRGRLDQLPPRTMLSLDQANNAITLRDIAPGQPIMLSMVRQSWRVKAGQRVQVVAAGDGFSVNSEGQALNNAAVAQNARVRMSSGQIVSGTVDPDGNILINL
ncbi:flagellar basal body P-ring formation protein FlgA [Enterobacteriaceae bacterium H20N1]|uniref:Flagella basal body P-ring formation protein FlgA n=1 Tax=Dryocola boscaweniae TaxID=2925397 RepID=A0A9X2WAZ3_9ENTR|nr:flagellar basal body P-ring formation chaperone FlgA [Dryocola boscaweniae]MCT4704235.1 flagellar basal body P-ring formation protein FlgA [Dryocola boscaweniae]MCT4717422.1 flagellar basal body P-ring formation protein FlgA [Dryocola boscaweniae]MCT4721403.1 flagellar basal body P-ring formation protein FlgA [Dryocola boscaweniae]